MKNAEGNPSFLQLVAEDLYRKFGDDLTKVTVVFPNYRSRLFFNNHIAEIAGKTIWSPRYTTIKDLFLNLSDEQIPDQTKLICILYKVYNQFVEKKETFDEFYFWGEMLLSDFDDVDKNMVNAKELFSNIRDMGEQIDTFEHLSEEQKECLKNFFSNFSPERSTLLKEQFIQLWDSLLDVYENFKKTLEEGEEKIKGDEKSRVKYAYEGMLYRKVIEKLRKEGVDGFASEKYAFIGFNVLNECEKELFKLLRDAGKALFYWDYDSYYTENKKNEAGRFINEDKLMFQNQLPGSLFDTLSTQKKKITFVSASTENAQARYLTNYLNEAKKENYKDADIAVVLCNEGLLLPVLHSIPESIEETNVTMGFPVSQTPAYSLILNMLDMQMDIRPSNGTSKYKYSTLAPLLRHPYIRASISSSEYLFKELSSQRKLYPTSEEILEINKQIVEKQQELKKKVNEKSHIDDIKKNNDSLKLLLRWADTPEELLQWILDTLRFIATYHRGLKKGNPNNQQEETQEQSQPTNSVEESQPEDSPLYEDLYEEALFRLYTQLNRLREVILEEKIEISTSITVRLIKRLLSALSVPFKGEPVKGMQIMGFLETRNLDFKNVILLSVNEGKLPNSGKENSFIPYNLRKGYGMTTIDHKNSLYAYYFYRLLQRAEKITMLYNTATEGMNRGQMSRFMLQLMVEKGENMDIEMLDIRSSVPMADPHPISIEKSDNEIKILKDKYDIRDKNKKERFFSPTAINCYIDCSLKFYFKYIRNLKVDEELTEDVDAPKFGSIFHKAAELFYKGRENQVLSKDFLLGEAENRENLERLVDEAFKTEYFQLPPDSTKVIDYTGEQLIYRKVETDLLQRLLKTDAEYAPFSIYELEQKHFDEVTIQVGDDDVVLKVGGIVDRIDLKEGVMRTVDYKTSSGIVKAASIESIFRQDENREGYLVQVILYAMILANENPQYTIRPALLFVTKKMDNKERIQIIKNEQKVNVEDIRDFSETYKDYLLETLNEIFDMTKRFEQTKDSKKCTYCDFRNICRRQANSKN